MAHPQASYRCSRSTRFDFAINMRRPKRFGVTIPPSSRCRPKLLTQVLLATERNGRCTGDVRWVNSEAICSHLEVFRFNP